MTSAESKGRRPPDARRRPAGDSARGANDRARAADPSGATAPPAAGPARLLAGLAVVPLLVFAGIALSRLGHPYELEWLEGAMLDQVGRAAAGTPLYAPPTLEYVPLNYPPLFYHAAALVGRVAGLDFAALRLLSALAAAAAFALVGVHVARETGRRSAGVVAAGVLAATQPLSGWWFDVGRTDSLFLALAVAAVVAVRRGSAWTGGLAAGALATLAFLTKQNAPALALPVFVAVLARDRARGGAALAGFAVTSAAAWLALDRASGGWLLYYAFEVPRRFAIDPTLAARWLGNLVWTTPALALAALGASLAWRDRARRESVVVHLALAAAWIGAAIHLSLHRGAHLNVYLTAHAALAIWAGLAWGWLADRGGRLAAAATALAALQILVLARDPLPQIPTPRDVADGDRLVRALRHEAGPVWVSSHPYLAERAGHPRHAHVAPLFDLLRSGDGPVERALASALEESLRARAWPALVLDQRDWLREGAVAAGYVWIESVFPDSQSFWPPAGMRTRPEYLMVPAESTGAGR